MVKNRTKTEMVASIAAADTEGFRWRKAADLMFLAAGLFMVVVEHKDDWIAWGFILTAAGDLGIQLVGVTAKSVLNKARR